MEIIFVTTNPGKMGEAKDIGEQFKVTFIQNEYDASEIRSESPEEIAKESARDAFKEIKKPLIVEDSGLFINALKGFPGTYSAYVYKTVGVDGIIKLMADKEDRSATMVSAVAYTDGHSVTSFLGEAKGTIPTEPKGKGGFGYDPIFIPEGRSDTFAEDLYYKASVSHRAQSLKKFCEWYSKK